jgi:hypothetical protein
MIKKLICILWGHSTIHKAITGETVIRTNSLTANDETVPLYALVRVPFCSRCGEKVHEDGEILQYPRAKK